MQSAKYEGLPNPAGDTGSTNEGIEPLSVQISIKEGPVILKNTPGNGIQASYPLWNGATASECFPPGTDSAFYTVTLEKPVNHPQEVQGVEQELIKTLLMFAAAWPFSGGSDMKIESRQLICAPNFSSNADDVERRLLAQRGLRRVTMDNPIGIAWSATYSQAPLKCAVQIADHMRVPKNFVTCQLLRYYRQARMDPSVWFTNLYKVREVIKKFYGSEPEARNKLSIGHSEWMHFGRELNNNDLRHADTTGKVPGAVDKDRLYGIAWRWISSYLRDQGLPAIAASCHNPTTPDQ